MHMQQLGRSGKHVMVSKVVSVNRVHCGSDIEYRQFDLSTIHCCTQLVTL